jgi:pyridoxamine 5'-phosphate oxidase
MAAEGSQTSDTGMRDTLRALPVLTGRAPSFDPGQAPADPVALFADWLAGAVVAGVAEPHAMTVSTVGPGGRPDARVLILKAVDADGWHFGVSAVSQKGRDLAANPIAALTFYWPELVRQVRLSGRVVADPAEAGAADFLARSAGSREMALTRRQSQPLLDPAEIDHALEKARLELRTDPLSVPDEWVSYAVRPDQVEFWQGATDRRHLRLRYEWADGRWSRGLLWP